MTKAQSVRFCAFVGERADDDFLVFLSLTTCCT
jgi:hypothetical protein